MVRDRYTGEVEEDYQYYSDNDIWEDCFNCVLREVTIGNIHFAESSIEIWNNIGDFITGESGVIFHNRNG